MQVTVDYTDGLVVAVGYLLLLGLQRLGLVGKRRSVKSLAHYVVPAVALAVVAAVRIAWDLIVTDGGVSAETFVRAFGAWGATVGQHAVRRAVEKWLEAQVPPPRRPRAPSRDLQVVADESTAVPEPLVRGPRS